MTQLVSPGVDVEIIDESQYAPSGPGTVPLIFVATQSYKVLPGGSSTSTTLSSTGTGIAAGTLPENAGLLYLITSQRELIQTFGTPVFYQTDGTPMHGYELNEVGLLAAYQYLGIGNRAYVMRGDIDTSQLFPTPFEPRGQALNGTYWLNTASTVWGIFESNGNIIPGLAWDSSTPIVITDTTMVETDITGVQGYASANSIVISAAGTYYLSINGIVLTFQTNGQPANAITLQNIVDAINNALILDIQAQVYRYAGLSWILIRNTIGGTISIDNTSTPTLLTLLGLDDPTEVTQPKVSLGQENSTAVITINNDNLIFQKITPTDRFGNPDPAASPSWFLIGTSSWKAAIPTYTIGSSTPVLPLTVGDKLIISDGVNTVTVILGSNFPTTTVVDIANEINLAVNILPPSSRPTIFASTSGTAIEISNWSGGDLTFTEPGTNSSLGVIAPLGIANALGRKLIYAPHTQVPNGTTVGSVWIKTTSPNNGANYVVELYNSSTAIWSIITAPLYPDDDTASIALGNNMAAGVLYVQYNIYGTVQNPIASSLIKRYTGPNPVTAVATLIPGMGQASSSVSIQAMPSITSASPFLNPGDRFVIIAGEPNGIPASAIITIGGPTTDAVVAAINAAASTLLGVSATTQNGFLVVTNSNKLTLTFTYIDPNSGMDVSITNVGDPLAQLGIGETTFSNWVPLVYEAQPNEPTTVAPDGTYWYNTDFRVDIMVGDGQQWHGYKNVYPETDPNGPILSGSAPLFQSNGNQLVDNDIWIDTTQLEEYPVIYTWSTTTLTWNPVDNADSTTPFGIVFSDARFTADGTEEGSQLIQDMLVSDYVDPDAPDPRTYPSGLMLFDTRYSFYNVKVWNSTYFSQYVNQTIEPGIQYNVGTKNFPPGTITTANIGRWVTASGNDVNGTPFMGRKAQRQIIIRALAAIIVANQDIRSEAVFFNLLSAPGYLELIDDLVTLNIDKKEIAFIITDTPARLTSDATTIQNWATNTADAATNGDSALITHYTYSALYYPPGGLTTNLDGSEAFIPSSAVALVTYGYNDNVAYPWFAPAGFTRGSVTNVSSVGYISPVTEQYSPVILNPGQRDVLYLNSINPIAYIPNRGLVVFGQKSLSPVASALDRVNVGRLICYLRYNLDIIAKPFLFEPNDKQTRDLVQSTFNRYMSNLIGLRAVYDFLVVCDESNNTPTRIDQNQLWIDIAIQPVKAIEFIYIPVRIQTTGSTLSIPPVTSQ